MKLKAIHCLSCNDAVYSRAEHDFRECSCGSVNADGGRTYFKHDTVPGAIFDIVEVDVPTSLNDLYDDWSTMIDNYGIIKEYSQSA
tara:strand:- start:117 stop:374 length:258 start_codon:yes stop_codon:yes gene_type:complete